MGFFSHEVQVGVTVSEPVDESNLWVTSYFGNSEQDANGVRSAAAYDTTSVFFGGGANINENWYLGAFGGYSRSEGQADSFGSSVENDGGYVGANAQFQSGDVFANFVGAFGFQDLTTVRRDFLGNRMEGDTEGFGGFLYGQFGRDFYFGGEDDVRVSPYVGLTVSSTDYDSYAEDGPTATSLRFSDERISHVQSVLGVSISGDCETRNGWIRPRADLAWWHDFDGDSENSAGLVASGLMNGFSVTSAGANANRGVLQLGVEFGCDSFEEWTFEVGYFGVYGDDDYSSHGGTAGVRLEF